jgi:hypothetical protein
MGPIAAGVLVSTIGYTGMFEVVAMVALAGAVSQLRPGPALNRSS